MIGLDTNVLVRYLVQDDAGQAEMASRQIESLTADCPGFINRAVLCELVWVLERAYGYAKSTVVDALSQIVRTAQFRVEDLADVVRAIEIYRSRHANFADGLIGMGNHRMGCKTTVTLDRRASRLAEFKHLRGQ